MPLLAYILIILGFILIVYGYLVRKGGLKMVPGKRPDPEKYEIKEEELVSFASKNLMLMGMVDVIIGVAMVLLDYDDWIIPLLAFLFTLLIFYVIRYANSVFVIPKD